MWRGRVRELSAGVLQRNFCAVPLTFTLDYKPQFVADRNFVFETATPPKHAIIGFVIRPDALLDHPVSIGPPEQTPDRRGFATTKEKISNA